MGSLSKVRLNLALLIFLSTSHWVRAGVEYLKTPNGGIQPQVTVDETGIVHLVYFSGDPKSGDLYYCTLNRDETRLSNPVRVNSEPKTAIALGSIRGAQIAVGKNRRVHIVWNGAKAAKGKDDSPSLFYTHLNNAGTAFEPQRNLMKSTKGLDGGGSIAADPDGNVYAVWHASGEHESESERAVYLARSSDDGATFETERKINPDPTGACGCCSMKALCDSTKNLYILYRAATLEVDRDTFLLFSKDKGKTFQSRRIDPWNINSCPMSSYSLSQGDGEIIAAWETNGQTLLARIDTDNNSPKAKIEAAGPSNKKKHPVAISNAKGETLFFWAEGTGWKKGGGLAWEILDRQNKIRDQGNKDGAIPVWSFAAAFSRSDGKFVIIY